MSATTPAATTPISSLRKLIQRRVSWLPVGAAVLILILMFAAGQSYFGRFLTPRLLSSLLVDNAYLIVLAAGMTFVILTGGIDLSVGAVMAFTGMLAAKLLSTGVPTGVVIPLMIASGAVFGLIIGVLVNYFDVQPFIASLAGMFLARGLCFVVSLEAVQVKDTTVLGLQSVKLGTFEWYITPTGIIALLVIVVAAWVLGYTRFGRTVYAIGGNEQSAVLMGLPVRSTVVGVYTLSGFCSALGGVVFTFYMLSGYGLHAIGLELDAIAAVVIGGTLLTGGVGYVVGTLFGVLMLGIIQTLISFDGTLSSWWTKIFIGALLLIFVILQRLLAIRRR